VQTIVHFDSLCNWSCPLPVDDDTATKLMAGKCFITRCHAIAKMTARCAPYIAYMGAVKFFGSPCMATPTANFPDIFNGLLFRSIP